MRNYNMSKIVNQQQCWHYHLVKQMTREEILPFEQSRVINKLDLHIHHLEKHQKNKQKQLKIKEKNKTEALDGQVEKQLVALTEIDTSEKDDKKYQKKQKKHQMAAEGHLQKQEKEAINLQNKKKRNEKKPKRVFQGLVLQ